MFSEAHYSFQIAQNRPTCTEALLRIVELFAVAYGVFVVHFVCLSLLETVPFVVRLSTGLAVGAAVFRLALTLFRRHSRDLLLLFSGYGLAVGVSLMQWSRKSDPDLFHAVAVRYWNSVDNKIPGFMARALMTGKDLEPFLFADWKSSDRPPLVSGFLLALGSKVNDQFIEFLVLVFVSSLLIIIVRLVVELHGMDSNWAAAVAVCVFCAPGIFTNVLYTWPKVPSASLVLIACALAIKSPNFPRWREYSGIAIALSFLSHGSSLFALVPLCILIAKRRGITNLIRILGCAFTTYIPWLLYQRFFDPPGNRLLYWHLAGYTSIPENTGVASAIATAYSSANFREIIGWKVDNFVNLFANNFKNDATAGYDGLINNITGWTQTTLLGSIGLGVMLLPVFLSARMRQQSRPHLPSLWLATSSVVCLCIFEIGNSHLAIATLHISSLATTAWFLVFLLETLAEQRRPVVQVTLMVGMLAWAVIAIGVLHPSGAAAGWAKYEFQWDFGLLALLSAIVMGRCFLPQVKLTAVN